MNIEDFPNSRRDIFLQATKTPDISNLVFSNQIEEAILEVENEIKFLLWHFAEINQDDEYIQKWKNEIQDLEFQAEVCGYSSELKDRDEFKQAQMMLAQSVGLKEDIKPIIKPLVEHRARLKKKLRYLEKFDPLNN